MSRESGDKRCITRAAQEALYAAQRRHYVKASRGPRSLAPESANCREQ